MEENKTSSHWEGQSYKTNEEVKTYSKNNMLLAMGVMLLVLGFVALAGFFLLKPPDDIIMGQVEAKEIRVSGKVPGRILSYRFDEGDEVKVGDTLVFLSTPEVRAKMKQAEAAQAAAQAQHRKAVNGARIQQISGAFEMWQKAKAGLAIAQKSFQRMQHLFDKGVVSEQKRDEVKAKYDAMVATEKAAHAQYDMAKEGARKEDKAATEALVQRAGGAVEEVKAYMKESVLLSPISGEITDRFPYVGELVGTGAPLMNITNLNDMWVVFSVRERLLAKFNKGQIVEGFIPALDKKKITMKVYYLKDRGSYAVWKATKPYGQYDEKTFEVRARMTEKIEGLRPGMSVVVQKEN